MNSTPAISVVMATFNDKPDLLSEAIDSIIGQTFTDWEFIIVDDSTSEDTISKLKYYSNIDNRIIYHPNENRLGFVASLNKGLELAKGKYIARMDGDDWSDPHRFEKEFNFLENNKKYAVVGSVISLINQRGNFMSYLRFPEKGLKFLVFSMFRCPIQHGDVMMRREIIDNGFAYDTSFERSEDLELWLRLIKNGYKLYNLQDNLYKFRIDDNYAEKRSKKHFKFNLRARIKNFSFRHPIIQLCGIIISYCYGHTPTNVKSLIYNKLNN